jgi:hypothetical protein
MTRSRMPWSNQGQSPATNIKEGLLGFVEAWEFKQLITSGYFGPYFVFDLNCGSGENRYNGANVYGSSVILKNQMKEKNISGYIHGCDTDEKAISEIRKHFDDGQGLLFEEWKLVKGSFVVLNNREFVPTIPQLIREIGENLRTAPGIVILDSNGLQGPIPEIAACLWQCRSLDIWVHLTGVNRWFGYCHKNPDKVLESKAIRSISQIFNMISRYWLFTPPWHVNGGQDHMVLFGSHRTFVPEIRNHRVLPNMISAKSQEGRRTLALIERREMP